MASYTWPSSGGSGGSDASVGVNGEPIPGSSTLIGGEDPSGNLQPAQLDSDKNLLVSVSASVLPTGGATAANQVLEIAGLDQIVTNTTGIATASNQSTEITALEAIEANQTNGSQITQITGTVPLPTDAATATNQSTMIASLASIVTNTADVANATDNVGTAIPSVALMIGASKSGVLEPLLLDSSSNLMVNVQSAALPTGAATAANQTNGTQVTQITSAGGGNAGINNSGLETHANGLQLAAAPQFVNYSSNPISTSAYTQILSTTSNQINQIDIFDSSGQAMILAFGASGLEVPQYYVPPGGASVLIQAPIGTRVSMKALTANATSGYLLMSFLN